jgi:CBS domain-containing protein
VVTVYTTTVYVNGPDPGFVLWSFKAQYRMDAFGRSPRRSVSLTPLQTLAIGRGLDMRIADILRQKGSGVVTIEADKTIHDAIKILNEHRIGAVVVTDQKGSVQGILSERDILRQCGEHCVRLGNPPKADEDCPSLVRDIMTTDLIIGIPDDEISYVMGIMTKNKIRHLPILDDAKLVGIISIGDVVSASIDETQAENRMLTDYVHGMTY